MNIVVNHSAWTKRDIATLFGNSKVVFTDCTNLAVLVASLGLFSSISQARKAGRDMLIPKGFTELKGNKKTPLVIWNPSE
jgi:hypothetical protein